MSSTSAWMRVVNRAGAKTSLTAKQVKAAVRSDARNSKRNKKPQGAAR